MKKSSQSSFFSSCCQKRMKCLDCWQKSMNASHSKTITGNKMWSVTRRRIKPAAISSLLPNVSFFWQNRSLEIVPLSTVVSETSLHAYTLFCFKSDFEFSTLLISTVVKCKLEFSHLCKIWFQRYKKELFLKLKLEYHRKVFNLFFIDDHAISLYQYNHAY